MTILSGKRGAWVNQYAEPDASTFTARARRVDYVILKYGLLRDGAAFYEALSRAAGVPWLAEKMPERGPAFAEEDGRLLGEQAIQPGCIGAVVNLEESDGNWHTDDGTRTRALIAAFGRAAPGVPLFASLDTRSYRAGLAYQRVAAELCAGVMPMIYPDAFGQSVEDAFRDALTPKLFHYWNGKDVIPTIQTYGGITRYEVLKEATICNALVADGRIRGANFYTLGHATDEEWIAALTFHGTAEIPLPPTVDLSAALIALAKAWSSQWSKIAASGTVAEAVALAGYWERLTK